MKKIIGCFILGFCLLHLVDGAYFEGVFDVIFFIALVLVGFVLVFGDSSSSSTSSTARTTSRSVNTGTGPEKPSAPPPQPQMVCPECGKKYPLGHVYCDECGSVLKKS